MTTIPQIAAAFIVGWCYYMLAMVMTVYDGVLSLIFQPIMGGILTAIAVLLMLALGLPIRLHSKLNRFWRSVWWLPIVLGTAAFIMMWLSCQPSFTTREYDPDFERDILVFHTVLAPAGWLLTLFSVLHFYPPIPMLFRRRSQT